jgi:hypothetical protein
VHEILSATKAEEVFSYICGNYMVFTIFGKEKSHCGARQISAEKPMIQTIQKLLQCTEFNSIHFYFSTNKSIHGQHNEKNYIDGEKGHLQN